MGLRVAKTDSTGSYSYLCDGTSAGSPVLWDGQAVYTAGLSERRGGVSSFYDFDRLGNLWTVDGSAGAVQLYYQDTTGFGGVLAAAGNVGTPFRFGGGNGCQTDADIGLVLMGHRYYDTRIGRFITQDPAGDGDNWYAYCGNDPTDGTDPEGLSETEFSYNAAMQGQVWGGGFDNQAFHDGEWGSYDQWGPNGSGDGKLYYMGTLTVGPSYLDTMMQGGLGLNMGAAGMGRGLAGMGGAMFAAAPKLSGSEAGPDGTRYRMDFKEKPVPDMHIVHSGGETNITHKGGYRQGIHRGQRLVPLPKKLRPSYRPIIKAFMKRAAQIINDFGEEFGRSQLNGGAAADTALEEAAGE